MTEQKPSRLYREMTWPEIAAAAHADIPVAIPIGSTEQHGHHLPVCTDWLIPEKLLEAASRRCDLVVGQFVPFGYRSRPGSGGGQHIPGTLSLRATTYIALLEDILGELKRAGFRNIVLYNWHYENSGFIYEPAFLISERHPELKILVIEDANPDFTPDRQQAIWPDGFPGLALEHAAVIETSLLLHHAPHLVRTEHIAADAPERVVNHDVLPIDTRMSTATGTLSSPEAASAEKGKMLTDWMVDRLVAILDEEFGDRRGGALTRVGEAARRRGRSCAHPPPRRTDRPSATDLRLVDQHDRTTELRGADRGGVSARTAADDDDICCGHGLLLELLGAGLCVERARPIGRAHQRSGHHTEEADLAGDAVEFGEFGWGDPAFDGVVPRRGPQVLGDGDQLASGGVQVPQGSHDLVSGLPHPEDQV